MSQTLWVFSTRTGQLIHSRVSPFGSPDADLRVGIPTFHQGDNGQIWVWAEKGDSILSYEIEFEKFRFSTPMIWSLAPNDNCVEWKRVPEVCRRILFDPAVGVVYVAEKCDASFNRGAWSTMVVQFEPTEGTPNYHIRNCEFLTLPAKTSKSRTQGNKDVELPNGRRHFRIDYDVFCESSRFLWTAGSYLTFEARHAHDIYVFGFPP